MASPSVNFGTCKGIGNGSIPYAAKVPGPVFLRFSEDVVLTLPQLHVLDVSHQVLLVGTDVLQHRVGGWSFRSIGCDDQGDERVTFVHRRSGQKAHIRLLNAPDDTSPPHRYTPSSPPESAKILNHHLYTTKDSVSGSKPSYTPHFDMERHMAAEKALLARENARLASGSGATEEPCCRRGQCV